MYLGEAFSSENLEEGYSIDSSCDTNVSRYFKSGDCLVFNTAARLKSASSESPQKLTRSTRKQGKAVCIPGPNGPDDQTGNTPAKAR
ncbi:hypothetical protein PsP108CL_06905 [Pseudomonas syringae]|nr:hypothetical protein [Pseudomonas syringae]